MHVDTSFFDRRTFVGTGKGFAARGLLVARSPPVPRRASSNAEQGNQNGCQPSDWPVVRVGHPIR